MFRTIALLVLAAPLLLLAPILAQKPQAVPFPAGQVRAIKDFKAELLYQVPIDKQGSWVNLCVDDKGRLIVSDQSGSLYRVTVPPVGKASPTTIEKIPADIGMAQGLLWAFDSLYVVVNRGRANKKDPRKFVSGLHRVTSSKNDDRLDKVELLRAIEGGGGEHGPHAVLLTPDKKNLVVVCGNQTKLARPLSHSRVPQVWGEDHLLERMPDGRGFMAGVLGPGGAIYQVTPDGKNWEVLSVGFRNQYDAAFNRYGELFTYDADMEWDMNTPWYRPTRVNHVTSGSEFGWRNGAGKWPAYYLDSLGSVVNVGPGSPTGVTFGYGAKFPARYQEAFFICDWSYGKLYATHLKPQGSSYTGELEEFVTGTPLALTDVVINPTDGAMYFLVGGRNTQSGLYRVTYVGNESTAPAKEDTNGAKERALRRSIEAHHRPDKRAVDAAWPYLDHEDRHIRFAARVALEHQAPGEWQKKALDEKSPGKAVPALLALARVSADDPQHGKKKADDNLKNAILSRLHELGGEKLTHDQQLDLLRVWEVAMNRMGPPAGSLKAKVTERLGALYPSKSKEMNAGLCAILVYLAAPDVAEKSLKLMKEAPTQEEQMEYARSLRMLKTGWTIEQRKEYFRWFLKAANFKGGNSLEGFIRLIKNGAIATLSEAEAREVVRDLLTVMQPEKAPIVGKPRPVIKKYTVADLVPVVEAGLKKKRDFDKGRRFFAEARCFVCHRFDNDGGAAGPDLTGVSGRFGIKDLLESVIEPSKTVSDQYAAVEVTTTRGKQVYGRIVNLSNDTIMINTDMSDPNAIERISRKQIERMVTSKLSMMPTGLLDGFKEEEIVDLMAYLLSRGDRKHKMFQ